MSNGGNATDSTDVASNSQPIGSGTQPLPEPPAPPPPGSEVDDVLDEIEDAQNTGGVWTHPRRH
jgi:hypothetical protein